MVDWKKVRIFAPEFKTSDGGKTGIVRQPEGGETTDDAALYINERNEKQMKSPATGCAPSLAGRENMRVPKQGKCVDFRIPNTLIPATLHPRRKEVFTRVIQRETAIFIVWTLEKVAPLRPRSTGQTLKRNITNNNNKNQ